MRRETQQQTLLELLDDLIADGHGEDMVSDGATDWDLDNLRDAVAGSDENTSLIDWIADLDGDRVVALVAIDPVTQRRLDHPPAYARKHEVQDLVDRLNDWQARFDEARQDPDYDGGWNYFDAIDDSPLIDFERSAAHEWAVLTTGEILLWLADRGSWVATVHDPDCDICS